jgi:RecB family endonuclease NucS
MANLFWKTKEGTKSLLSTPFKTENEFEKLIFNIPEILEDIFFLKRQIRGGNKDGIPDIVGIDNDGNICIVEMKNINVDASIISQVLQFAILANKD